MSSIHEAIKKTYSSLMEHGNHVATLQSEEDFRGERFKDFPHSLKGQRFIITHATTSNKSVHAAYFEAELILLKPIPSGTTIGMADYHLEDMFMN
jgi:5-methyltetrahydrofolate--homocysteine methyltransferase